jgi:hypothetical protein
MPAGKSSLPPAGTAGSKSVLTRPRPCRAPPAPMARAARCKPCSSFPRSPCCAAPCCGRNSTGRACVLLLADALVSPGPNHCLHGIPSGWSHVAPFAVRRPAHRPRHALVSTRSRGRCHARPAASLDPRPGMLSRFVTFRLASNRVMSCACGQHCDLHETPFSEFLSIARSMDRRGNLRSRQVI